MANPFVHMELHAEDLARAKKFYKSLFDWQLVDTKFPDGSIYTMIGVGEGTAGGMMKKPMPTAPAQWLTYVQVDDVKVTIAKAQKQGAQIIVPHQEIPNVGAFGIFMDPDGAPLGVFQPLMPAPTPAKKKKPAAKKPAAKKPAAKKPARKR
jgi:uncharacterized protein